MKVPETVDKLNVKIHSPFVTYFDGEAISLSGVNETGPFDILPQHHKFLSLLSPCDLVVRLSNGDEKKFPIDRGVMHVKGNQIVVFLDV